MMVNDDWMTTAMADETVVAELLLRLKRRAQPKSPLLPFTWGLKQPRSRSRLTASVSRCDAAVSTRFSPTTPLSWSGGGSPSATADGYEDSSLHAARSKATATSGYTGNSASAKKCRKKKTFAQLQQEETSLMKERVYLKEEIATRKANFEAERAKNENLKRMKLDVGSKSQHKPSPKSVGVQSILAGQPHQRIMPVTRVSQDETHSQASESRPNRMESTGESFFLIPDLNMMPSDDGSYTGALCGMS